MFSHFSELSLAPLVLKNTFAFWARQNINTGCVRERFLFGFSTFDKYSKHICVHWFRKLSPHKANKRPSVRFRVDSVDMSRSKTFLRTRNIKKSRCTNLVNRRRPAGGSAVANIWDCSFLKTVSSRMRSCRRGSLSKWVTKTRRGRNDQSGNGQLYVVS
jgi:hypothetical protein